MTLSFKETLPTKPKTNNKMTRYHSAPFPSCFRPPSSTTTLPALEYPHAPPSATATATTTATNPNLTTCLYQTHLGIFSLTWSRSLLSRSLHLNLHPHLTQSSPSSLNSLSFHLSLKPFLFWNKQGFKKLTFTSTPVQTNPNSIWVFWDLTHARFGPGPEPESGFYIAVLSDGEMTLLVGDMEKEAFLKTRAKRSSLSCSNSNKSKKKEASLVLRREHVVGKNKFFTTRTNLGGKSRLISIELNDNNHGEKEDPRLVIRFDQKRVLQVKHLKWKFRGNERIEVDGHPIQLSWDVYNWLFEAEENNQEDGYALFTFRFEKQGNFKQGNFSEGVELFDEENSIIHNNGVGKREKGVVMWSQDSCGLNYERKKMKNRLLMKTRSPSFSSSSISSVSSSCSSVLEWESVEENELKGPTGFSLLVYAWKS